MDQATAVLFWVLWFLVAFLTCIIFLNFIIAEAAESYAKVNENIDNILAQRKIVLLNETEEMAPHCYLNSKEKFPKYLVSRKIEI